MYDLMIRNATIVDGTGAPAFTGSVAVKDGRIAAIGDVQGSARRDIDAQGHLLTPGWVDVHSHLDARCWY